MFIEKLNENLKESGGSVQFVKRNQDGSIMETIDDSTEMADQVDRQLRQAQLANMLSCLNTQEKFEWALQVKESGNQLYYEEDYSNAIQKYLDALLGLDFGNTQEETDRAKNKIQIPIVNNLCACYVALEQWYKVVNLSKEVLALEPNNVKAYLRRAVAYTNMGKFREAKVDIQAAEALKPGCAKTETLAWRKALAIAKETDERNKMAAKKMIEQLGETDERESSTPISDTRERDFNPNICTRLYLALCRFLEFRTDPKLKFE